MAAKLPGAVLALAIAVAAYLLGDLPFAPFTVDGRHPVEPMLIAIVLGMVVRNVIGLHPRLVPGVRYAVTGLMAFGIVLMGARLDFFDVVRTSAKALAISCCCVAVALALTIYVGKRLGLSQKLGILVGIGTAICGGTAIAVVAPVIEAEESDTAYAIATVTLFGMIAVFVLPLLGGALHMTQLEFGVWAGTSVHQTPQVIATGFAYGPEAGDIATIVKLVRVLLLAPVVVGAGIWYARDKRNRQQAHVAKSTKLTTLVPPFVIGFVVLALANTLHLLPDFTLHLRESVLWDAGDRHVVLAKAVTQASTFILTIAMAGVGLGVHVKKLLETGLGALYAGLISAVILATFSYGLLTIVL